MVKAYDCRSQREYGLSDRGLAKLCERNSIPVPPRGYWAKKAAGQKVKKAPLIVLDDKELETAILLRKASPAPARTTEEPALPEAIQEAIYREKRPENLIKVPATLHKPHMIVDGWIQDKKRQVEYNKRYGGISRRSATPLNNRKWRISSALFKTLETRGFKITEEGGNHYHRDLLIRYERDGISYQIRERITASFILVGRRKTEKSLQKSVQIFYNVHAIFHAQSYLQPNSHR